MSLGADTTTCCFGSTALLTCRGTRRVRWASGGELSRKSYQEKASSSVVQRAAHKLEGSTAMK